jgi:CHAD domain-containing protein
MRSAATRAVTDYLNAQIDEIENGDEELRLGELRQDKDVIHDTRVAIRRSRSTLRVFAKLLGSKIGDLDRELKWFAGLLGDVRDCEVQRRRFGAALDGMPDELILGPVRSRIRNDLQAIELPARARLREAMDSDRYRALLGVLRGWRDAPPVGEKISARALRKRARRAERKADRRLAAALESDPEAGGAAMLHRARKAAKRARYAAELRKPLDKRAKRTVKHYKRIQSLLGDHQDTVVATQALRQMALTAGTTVGENGFSYGMLYAREQQIARQCREDALQLV